MTTLDELRQALDFGAALYRIELSLERIQRTQLNHGNQLSRLITKGTDIMASLDDFNTQLDGIEASIAATDTDVDDVKALIESLTAQIGTGGLTAEEEAAVLARITAANEALAALEAEVDAVTPDA